MRPGHGCSRFIQPYSLNLHAVRGNPGPASLTRASARDQNMHCDRAHGVRMHVVTNHIALQDGVDRPRLEAKVEEFNAPVMRGQPQCLGVSLARESGGHAIFLARFAGLASLQSIYSHVAAPWFSGHVKPLLSAPVDRHVGEIVAGDLR